VAKKARSAAGETNGRNATTAGRGEGETVAGYFRKVFKENPRLLRKRSNEELFKRWLADHPGFSEVPKQVRTGLQNIKSVLRQERGKKKHARAGQAGTAAAAEGAQPAPRRISAKGLEQLEEHIDECLALAKHTDREALGDVIALLRRARNVVVVKLGAE
jgi:hypothetical protein